MLFILADDLGVDFINAYGVGPFAPPTPNIDRIASEGVLFRNAWANPVCSPTRACVQTGRHAFRTGVGTAIQTGAGGTLPAAEMTVPELLDGAHSGYAHAIIGKWHLASGMTGSESAPNLAGWSHFAGLIPGATPAPYNYFIWPRTVDGVTAASPVYATTKMVDDAVQWIQSQGARPWVCYLSFFAPHRPFHAPPHHLHTQPLTGKQPWNEPLPFYQATVEAMDTEIGRLLNTLGSQLDDTYVIFMGDNGTPAEVSKPPFLPQHAKGSPYQGGVNVPLVVRGPRIDQPGRESDALVSAVDVFSTVLDMAAVDVDAVLPDTTIDGASFLPVLDSATAGSPHSLIFTEWFFGDKPNLFGWAIVRDSRYKLIRRFSPIGKPYYDEFYDLETDPFETTNLMISGTADIVAGLHYTALSKHIIAIRASK